MSFVNIITELIEKSYILYKKNLSDFILFVIAQLVISLFTDYITNVIDDYTIANVLLSIIGMGIMIMLEWYIHMKHLFKLSKYWII